MEKKIKDTKVGKWITEKLPDVASTIGNLLPDSGVLGIIKRVVDTDPSLSHEQKVEFERLMMEEEMGAQEQVTKRWEADAGGDVKLAKYIRPVTLIVLTIFYMGLTVWDGVSLEFTPSESYISLLEILMLTVFGAYFAGRTIEKVRK